MTQVTPFVQLLQDRERAYMSSELVAIREDLFGSAPLIALVAAGKTPAELSTAVNWGNKEVGFLPWFFAIGRYVSETAWADTALKATGHSPLTQPFLEPVTAALKAATPNWTPLWEYIQQQRAQGGSLVGNSAWDRGDLQAELERVLGELNSKFIEVAEASLAQIEFPHHDGISTVAQSYINSVIADVQPLPAQLQHSALEVTFPPSMLVLEELRSRGQAMRSVIASAVRLEGNADFLRAAQLQGAEQAEAYESARQKFSISMQCIEQADTSSANLVAVALLTKEYEMCIDLADSAMSAILSQTVEPTSYRHKRAMVVLCFRAGKRPVPPQRSLDAMPKDVRKAHRMLTFKVLMRKARALAALCLQCLEGDGARDEEQRERAEYLYEHAEATFSMALDLKVTQEPRVDFLKFRDQFEEAMYALERTGVADHVGTLGDVMTNESLNGVA